jgi:hypothetical protein
VVGVLQAFIAHSGDLTARQAANDVLEKLSAGYLNLGIPFPG